MRALSMDVVYGFQRGSQQRLNNSPSVWMQAKNYHFREMHTHVLFVLGMDASLCMDK